MKLDLGIVRGVDGDPARQSLVAGMVHYARTTEQPPRGRGRRDPGRGGCARPARRRAGPGLPLRATRASRGPRRGRLRRLTAGPCPWPGRAEPRRGRGLGRRRGGLQRRRSPARHEASIRSSGAPSAARTPGAPATGSAGHRRPPRERGGDADDRAPPCSGPRDARLSVPPGEPPAWRPRRSGRRRCSATSAWDQCIVALLPPGRCGGPGRSEQRCAPSTALVALGACRLRGRRNVGEAGSSAVHARDRHPSMPPPGACGVRPLRPPVPVEASEPPRPDAVSRPGGAPRPTGRPASARRARACPGCWRRRSAPSAP